MSDRRTFLAALGVIPALALTKVSAGDKKMSNLVTQIMALVKKDQDAQMFRAICVARFDTAAGGFTVQIRRIGEALPDDAHYRYIGPSPSVGDDVVVFRIGGSFYVGAVDETTLDRQGQGILVSNTTVETVLYSFTVPANTLGIINGLLLLFTVSFLDSATTTTYTIRVKLNGITVVTPLSAVNFGASGYTVVGERITNRGVTNAQLIVNPFGGSFFGALLTAAADTTSNVLVDVTGQMSAAGAGISMRLETVLLERE